MLTSPISTSSAGTPRIVRDPQRHDVLKIASAFWAPATVQSVFGNRAVPEHPDVRREDPAWSPLTKVADPGAPGEAKRRMMPSAKPETGGSLRTRGAPGGGARLRGLDALFSAPTPLL